MDKQKQSDKDYEFTQAAYKWHSWDSPVGLAFGLVGLALSASLILSSLGLFFWLLHIANIIK